MIYDDRLSSMQLLRCSKQNFLWSRFGCLLLSTQIQVQPARLELFENNICLPQNSVGAITCRTRSLFVDEQAKTISLHADKIAARFKPVFFRDGAINVDKLIATATIKSGPTKSPANKRSDKGKNADKAKNSNKGKNADKRDAEAEEFATKWAFDDDSLQLL